MFQQSGVSLFIVLLICTCAWSTEILLNSNIGEDNATCLEESSRLPCRSLEFIADRLRVDSKCQNNLTIRITSEAIELGKVVSFKKCKNLSILSDEPVKVQCTYNGVHYCNDTGLKFSNVAGLWMKNLNLYNCSHSKFRKHSAAAVQVLNSRDVKFQSLEFVYSRETGVVFNNTYGTVLIINSSFVDNELLNRNIYSYPGGIYILFSQNNTWTTYTLTNCSFLRNTAPIQFSKYNHNKLGIKQWWTGGGHGGGLGIIFTGKSNGISLSISESNFTMNKAIWGGGLHIHFQDDASNNTVVISGTEFRQNRAIQEGGGINAGFIQAPPSGNQLLVLNSLFYNNTAVNGGGTALFGRHAEVAQEAGVSMKFQSCIWQENQGKISAAVSIASTHLDRLSQGFLPVPVFQDCKFIRNELYTVKEMMSNVTATHYTNTRYSGVLTVTKASVVFQGSTIFKRNKNTALYTISGQLIFNKQSEVLFQDNYGSRGAAIAMYGFSSLIFGQNSFFNFTNNSATSVGGAMYYETFDQNDFIYGRKCFLRYKGPTLKVNQRNVNFTFERNKALTGSSIHASTFYPCFNEWFNKITHYQTVTKFFNRIANFSFHDKETNESKSLATNGRKYKLKKSVKDNIAAIPGGKVTVPLEFLDELGGERSTAYTLRVQANTTVEIKPQYAVETTASFYGKEYGNFSFVISAHDVRKSDAVINMYLLPCPPGFYYNNKSMSCECAADDEDRAFAGMTRCNTTAFYAYIHYGFWGGYDSLNKFYTALCPLSFCALTTNSSNPRHLHALPSSQDELNDVMCGTSRTGILCGECRVNHSVYYHSRHFECKQNQFCKLGILFYILSEIFPTVILFSVIIAFNISFTSGNMNGFIFFCQVLSSISLIMKTHNNHIMTTISFINIFYGILNLDFFNIDKLSFCLWEGATVMDILVFKYVTIIFALLLVVGLIVLMNSRLCTKFNKKVKMNLSVIHGLSAFLVICYTQCTKISFYILTRVVLQGEGGVDGPAVTFFGGIPYMKGKHLLYVIPALICLVTITIIPPLLLLIYPLLYQLLSLCGLSEHRIVTKVSNAIAIHKLMPIFDSFQSCYKDKLRFFAGLYFVYRIVILLLYSINKTATAFYTSTAYLLLLIAGLHSVVQPYKKNLHNWIDSLLFLNLALVNFVTLHYNLYAIVTRVETGYLNHDTAITVINIFQMKLISLPLLSIIFWLLFVTTKKLIKHIKNRRENLNDTTTENDNDELILSRRDLGEEIQYFELTDHDHDTENETLNNK